MDKAVMNPLKKFWRESSAVFLPDSRNYTGGPATFVQNLAAEFQRQGIAFTSRPEASNLRSALIPVEYDLDWIREWKRRGVRIVQRLDGVYYPSKHGEAYRGLNRNLELIYRELADAVIYQSRYSYLQCREVLGLSGAKSEVIILNGADTELFHPVARPPATKEGWIFASSGNFRNIDMLEPMVHAFDRLYGKFPFQLRLFGDVIKEDLLPYLKRPYIRHVPRISLKELGNELRGVHAFVYSHLNPPCPNSVIEAISSGLPVVGFDSGSMSELLWYQKDLLAPVSNDILQLYKDFDSHRLVEKIQLLLENYDFYLREARRRSRDLTIERTAAAYISVLLGEQV
jgi:glycosyltransferase involved in cell wall biosynthesis